MAVSVKAKSFLFALVAIMSACGGNGLQSSAVVSVPATVEPTPVIIPSITPAPSLPPSPPPAQELTSATPQDAFEDNLPLAARVNDQPIFLETYEKQVAQFEQALKARQIDRTDQELLPQVRRQVLEVLINRLIIEQQADQLGITITEAAVQAKVQENIAPGQADLETWLATNHLTEIEFQDMLRFQLIATQLFEQVTSEISDTTEKEKVFKNWLKDQRSAAIIEKFIVL